MHHQTNTASAPAPTGDRALPINVVLERLACGRSHLYAMIRAKEVPGPTKFGRQSRWSEKQLDAWLQARFGGN
jgi:excisionase family DNA binding protein